MKIAVDSELGPQLNNLKEFLKEVQELEKTTKGLHFLTVDEIVEKKILPWSRKTVQDLFNRPDFPSCDYGKEKVVEVYAFKEYFNMPRRKKRGVQKWE